jgi:hypothetical protein
MMVVPDIDDLFLPVPDDLLVNLNDSMHVVEALLDSLPLTFQANQRVESALGPALRAAYGVMVSNSPSPARLPSLSSLSSPSSLPPPYHLANSY